MALPDTSMFYTDSLPVLERGRLRISFSGGRTSALMTAILLAEYRDRQGLDVAVTFANTGQEDERTLEFVHRCDTIWGFRVVWLEADVVAGRGNGTRSRVVSYHTASRDGRPYEDFCAKYGIPNRNRIWCTRELKERPMDHYTHNTLQWRRGSYHTAIGIRADEMDRISLRGLSAGFVYPLVTIGVTKAAVLSWFMDQPFDLATPEHFGNCVWCWKKTDRKLFTVAKERPDAFDFPARMERVYGEVATHAGAPQVFFRHRRSATDILREADMFAGELYHDAFTARMQSPLDVGASCGESCEVGADTD